MALDHVASGGGRLLSGMQNSLHKIVSCDNRVGHISQNVGPSLTITGDRLIGTSMY